MKVFITGASGWVGRHITKELIEGGHTVLGLARSPESAAALTKAGATPVEGTLEDLDILKKAATEADGVIHCGFVHDFTRFKESCEIDLNVIKAIGSVLEGTNKPFLVSSGTGGLAGKGTVSTELDKPEGHPGLPRYLSELETFNLAKKGVRAIVIRLPPSTHGNGDKGFVPMIIGAARKNGKSAYIGQGANRWPSGHVEDAAHLYCLALEKGKAGSAYHAVHDTGIPTKDIAEAIAKGAGVPLVSYAFGSEEATAHFPGFMAFFFGGLDNPSSSEITRKELGWEPKCSTLLENLAEGTYFDNTAASKY
ncbi:NAD dependent epimerase/dehydratase family protein [Meredithblackwellia eburnea MCA 4105]